MSSEKQKQAARKNIKKAQATRRHKGGNGASGMSTAEKDRLVTRSSPSPNNVKNR
jgi:hypothetical protein